MPDEPSWFYKLDESVYQGYRHGMAVPLLALNHLRRTSTDNFSFVTDREFWKHGASKPDAEADLFCVSDGVLAVGEAKKGNSLGQSVSEENAEITKYKRIISGFSARQLILATFCESWSEDTVMRVMLAFKEMPFVSIRLLTAPELLASKT
jgi:hypothetical protein